MALNHALIWRDAATRSDTVTRSIAAIRRIFRALHHSARRAERELGLSGAQLFVLQQLDERAARSLNELADRTHTHQSSVSVVVRRLVERGLVARSRSPEDARRVQLRLTAAGRGVLRRSRPAGQLRLIQAIAGLPPARRRDLASTLERLVGQMGLAASPAAMMFTGPAAPSPSIMRNDG
jgi:DNA-binding MarR family transcriptional regulator